MLIPFGILSAAGVSGVIPGDYELISTTILGGTAASITFSNLGDYSSTYKHLQVRYTGRSNQAQTYAGLRLTFNGDTAANYGSHILYGNGSNVFSAAYSSTSNILLDQHEITGASVTASIFGSGIYDILDAYSTTKNKTVRFFGGRGAIPQDDKKIDLGSGLWRNTASITSITFTPNGDLIAGSRFSLYGIRG
jgi:hypothetical protein